VLTRSHGKAATICCAEPTGGGKVGNVLFWFPFLRRLQPGCTIRHMTDRDRFRLLGVYATPRLRVGRILACEARDCDVIVVGYSDGRIPWPIGRRPRTSARSLVVFGGLTDAIRRESNQAVCYWFGVTPQTVSKWRKLLGIGLTNPGTYRLRSDYSNEPWLKRALKKAHAKNADPERRRKIAEAKRGKPRPAHVIEAMRKGRTGKPQPPHVGQIVAASNRRRKAMGLVGNGKAWTVEDDNLIRTLSAAEVVQRTGRTLPSIYSRRVRLGVEDKRKGNGRKLLR
jgi:hypothetical protein